MKIFALSDIRWNAIRLDQLIARIEKLRPDMVLLAGDLVNDKFGSRDGQAFSAERYWDEVAGLLAFLNGSRIQTFFVRGNWDEAPRAKQTLTAASERLRYVKDISERTAVHGGLKFVGLSHAFTSDLARLKSFIASFHQRVDIVLAHAEFKRRIWLFHLDPKLIVTGHFDSQLSGIHNTVLISMDRFPSQYAIIDYHPTDFTVQYVNQDLGIRAQRKAAFAGGRLHWKGKPIASLRHESEQYADRVEQLLAARTALELEPGKASIIRDSLVARGVPKRHVEDYLGIGLSSKKGTR